MAFKHVILGLLTYKPRSGYSLRKIFFEPLRPSLPYLYRILSNMADEGIITFERVENIKLPARNICHITAAGRAELKRWLKEGIQAKPVREPFLQKLLFSGVLGKEELIANFEKYSDQREKEWEYYESDFAKRTTKLVKARGHPLDGLCWDLFIEYIRCRQRYEKEWVEASINLISSMKFQDATSSAIKKKGKGKRVKVVTG